MKPVTLSPGFGDNRPTATLYYGQDVRESLRLLPEASVHTVCTSPPYFGLRDYGIGDKQIGLEPTPEEFVAALVDVFREVRRVLRDDGTLWLNLGDSYATQGGRGEARMEELGRPTDGAKTEGRWRGATSGTKMPPGLKPKDLIGIPWRVAFALQADGWYLRQDIIWAKPNPMPESVTDRCTKAHEYVFLMTKSERYYYDAEAVSEALSGKPHAPGNKCSTDGGHMRNDFGTDAMQRVWGASGRRNRRSVWTVTTKPYSGAHFAVMPAALVEPMIRAGCPEGGVVLDPFSGSATTGTVALREGRNYIGIDLNPDYLPLAEARLREDPAPRKAEEDPERELDLFDLFGEEGSE